MKSSPLRILWMFLALAGLGLTLVPALLVFMNAADFELHKYLMACGAVLWFVFAPLWMKKK